MVLKNESLVYSYSGDFCNLQIMADEPKNRGINGKFLPGQGGRPPGEPNKLTKTVKETVLAVFNDLQADPKHSLIAFARRYPRDFYNIAAKLIPTEISGKLVTTINVIETQATGCLPLEANAN